MTLIGEAIVSQNKETRIWKEQLTKYALKDPVLITLCSTLTLFIALLVCHFCGNFRYQK